MTTCNKLREMQSNVVYEVQLMAFALVNGNLRDMNKTEVANIVRALELLNEGTGKDWCERHSFISESIIFPYENAFAFEGDICINDELRELVAEVQQTLEDYVDRHIEIFGE